MIRKLLILLALALLPGPVLATSCYTPTYSYSSTYTPSYAYPVTTFLGVPIPILYGSVYTGPGSTAAYAPTTPASGTSGELTEALKLLRGLTTRLDGVAGRLDALEGRIRTLELRGPAPKAAEPPAAGETKLPDPLVAYKNSCAACHQRGNEAAGGKFVLLEADGARAALTAEQVASFTEHIVSGTMPPPRNKKGIAPLDNLTANAMLLDARKFPKAR